MSLNSKKDLKIIVSGFEPFANIKFNPSQKLVESLKETHFEGIRLNAFVLPVDFDKAFKVLKEKIQLHKPQIVIASGLAVQRSSICLEARAQNLKNTKVYNDEHVASGMQTVDSSGREEVFTSLPLKRWAKLLNTKGFSTKISMSAGTYVCNALMYRLINLSQKQGFQAGFIHIPNTSASNPYAIHMSDDQIYNAFECLLKDLSKNESPN